MGGNGLFCLENQVSLKSSENVLGIVEKILQFPNTYLLSVQFAKVKTGTVPAYLGIARTT
jgi:hypothetical protein